MGSWYYDSSDIDLDGLFLRTYWKQALMIKYVSNTKKKIYKERIMMN
jgi:hypothetical protein